MDTLYYILLIAIIVLVIIIIIAYYFLQKNDMANSIKPIIINWFDFDNYCLPKIIWVYWGYNTPICIKNILKNNTSIIKKWKINFLTDATLSKYIPDKNLPVLFKEINVIQKSDWIRLYLLEKYGGCWLDAGIIINTEDAINKLRDESIKKQSIYTGFYLDGRIIDNNLYSYVEAWFIMAPKNSSIIKAWRKEFEKAIHMKFYKYKKLVQKNKNLNLKNIYYDKYDTYLTIYACFYNISQYFDSEIKKHIILYKAEDTMYKIHTECNWDNKCIQNRLKTVKTIPYIKLNSQNRKDFNFEYYSEL
jgi:hypothetical protein